MIWGLGGPEKERSCDRQNNAPPLPKDVHILMPITCEYVNLKSDFLITKFYCGGGFPHQPTILGTLAECPIIQLNSDTIYQEIASGPTG